MGYDFLASGWMSPSALLSHDVILGSICWYVGTPLKKKIFSRDMVALGRRLPAPPLARFEVPSPAPASAVGPGALGVSEDCGA
jgi:hypothetical protein